MKIGEKYKVREMAGEHIVVLPGRYGADMTRVLALNASSLYLWQRLVGREFAADDIVRLLIDRYEVEESHALRDAEAWIARLAECGILEKVE